MTKQPSISQVPQPYRASVENRFWSKVIKGKGCWKWLGTITWSGYSEMRLTYNGSSHTVRGHVAAYELTKGPVPTGFTLDHLCRNRACVNPYHLEPVSPRENTLRGNGIAAQEAVRTHCPQGHPYSTSNTRVDGKGTRHCKTCAREYSKRYRERRKYRV